MQPGGSEPSFMPNQTFHLFQPRIKYGVACDGFDPTFRVRWIVMCIWEERNILLDFLLFSIFPLSSPSAHSEMSGFCSPPQKKQLDYTSLSEPKANSEERRQGTRMANSEERELLIKMLWWGGYKQLSHAGLETSKQGLRPCSELWD